MKQRRINATLIVTALALTALLILTALPRAGTAAPRLERQPLESLSALNVAESAERGAPLSAFSVPSVASVVQAPGTTTPISAAPRLERQPLESLSAPNVAEAAERGAPVSGFSATSVASVVQSPGATTRVSAALHSSPVMFIENVGQFDERVRFQVRGVTGTLANAASFATTATSLSSRPAASLPPAGKESGMSASGATEYVSAASNGAQSGAWQIECVDCPRYFDDMTNRSLALDQGRGNGWAADKRMSWRESPSDYPLGIRCCQGRALACPEAGVFAARRKGR